MNVEECLYEHNAHTSVGNIIINNHKKQRLEKVHLKSIHDLSLLLMLVWEIQAFMEILKYIFGKNYNASIDV